MARGGAALRLIAERGGHSGLMLVPVAPERLVASEPVHRFGGQRMG